ncbi:MAG: hypothetical protein FJW26_09650 [Acidimicrobiia bacterium]|nr:hypothetical protein [Acidimicrobiia bacterium]
MRFTKRCIAMALCSWDRPISTLRRQRLASKQQSGRLRTWERTSGPRPLLDGDSGCRPEAGSHIKNLQTLVSSILLDTESLVTMRCNPQQMKGRDWMNRIRTWIKTAPPAWLFALIVCLAAHAHGQKVEPRLNRVIELFQSGKVAAGGLLRGEGLDFIQSFDETQMDFVIFDLEHRPTDLQAVRVLLQGMLDRADIVRRGSLQPRVVPLIRIPANGGERNQNQIKQSLDLGVYGIVVPQMETAEDLEAAISATRYSRSYDADLGMPVGIRGVGPQVAQRYWGLSRSDYFDRAEVWPVKPYGELLLIPMIETRKAVENIEKIVRVKGLSALMIGPGDMQVSFGHTKPYPGGGFPPDVEAAIQKVARAARDARVPFGITAGPNDVEARVRQGFQFLVGGEDTARKLKATGRGQ